MAVTFNDHRALATEEIEQNRPPGLDDNRFEKILTCLTLEGVRLHSERTDPEGDEYTYTGLHEGQRLTVDLKLSRDSEAISELIAALGPDSYVRYTS
ncbi:MAG: hypothetical protein SP1CHLAM54_12440 [Chlamydiia bacterium]|nr:hypothetical protein [Chlamydiia bacterium]MCH9616142.1 hypothetical protein [Chlamydiia bacterium]MCH9629872.1 hypothetical protein [Chlamydiia bacterium]